MVAAVVLSSARDDFETPGRADMPGTFFYNLNQEFDFDCDVAADAMNAKCERFLCKEDDALNRMWPGKRNFGNPPYGKGNKVGRWMDKAAIEINRKKKEVIVMLTAARTDTGWFHEVVWPLADEIRVIKGRMIFELDGMPCSRFDKKRGIWIPQAAPFPAMVTVFRKKPFMRSESGPYVSRISKNAERLDEPPL